MSARAALLALALAALARPAAAEDAPAARTTCVDVRIGDERYYDCLNRMLRQSVPQRRFSAADAPWNAATTPSYAVGGFNEQATKQMLGTNFGVSTVPQRPPVTLPPPPFAPGSR